MGDLCDLQVSEGESQLAEVIGFSHGVAQILPFEDRTGLRADTRVIGRGRKFTIPVGTELLGRVLDGLGRPLDSKPAPRTRQRWPLVMAPPSPMLRQRVERPFVTGQRVIDGLLTMGRGQRVGLFAGSGVGKSTLLGEIAKGAESDINVIALIGERGREVRPFLDDCLGSGLEKSIAFVATADQTPLMRVRAAESAVAVADYFRRQGANVLFMLDSMTRIAHAQREIGLQLGEPPSSRGYTPSVFQLLARLLEQLGNSDEGGITAIVTVLVDGDDLEEPISDAVRSIVDGHFVLDRHLAEKGHFPAINVGRSVSRVFRDVTQNGHQQSARKLRALLATYEEVADLVRIGAYEAGSSPEVDAALKVMPALQVFLRQRVGEYGKLPETVAAMARLADAWPF